MDKVEPVKAAIDRVIAEIDALKRRANDAENVAWTLILNLEQCDELDRFKAIKTYAVNEARPFLLRSPNPPLPVTITPRESE